MPGGGRLRRWAASLKSRTLALYLASRDPRVPLPAKVLAGLVVAYALSPLDLIPDFIPVVGYLDDLLLLPLGIWMAIRMIPDAVWQDCLARAAQQPLQLPRNLRAAAAVVIIWLLVAGVAVLCLWKLPGPDGLQSIAE